MKKLYRNILNSKKILYLDTNVLSAFNEATLEYFNTKIHQYKLTNQAQIYYSNAHIEDKFKCKSLNFLEQDFNNISDITQNNMLLYSYTTQSLDTYIKHPKEAFQDISDAKDNTIESMIANILELQVNNINPFTLKDIKQFLKVKKSMRSLRKKYYIYNKLPLKLKAWVEMWIKAVSIFDICMKSLKEPLLEISIEEYKANRKKIVDILDLNILIRANIEVTPQAVDSFFNTIVIPKYNITFTDLLKVVSPAYAKTSIFEKIITIASVLDQLGVAKDKKLNSKHNLDSIRIDSYHIAYAGCFSDYLITFDKDMLKKAKFIYSFLKLKTIACTPHEF